MKMSDEMDAKRKKELIYEWKNRCPEMGVVSFRCKEIGETFLGISKDIKAEYNSNCFKLRAGMHPNQRMQELFNRHGEECFEYAVVKVLKYDDPQEDHTDELLALRDACLAADPQAQSYGSDRA